jgi:hypothetical protein
MTEPDWSSAIDRYTITYPFGDTPRAIKINEEDVDDELLQACVEQYIISKVAKGYYITHEDIEQHLEVINEHGIEAYLEKRLERAEDE